MDRPIALNPTDQIPVRLEAQQWNQVLMIISEAPWKIAAPLIEQIRSQCMTHEQHELDARPAAPAEPGKQD